MGAKNIVVFSISQKMRKWEINHYKTLNTDIMAKIQFCRGIDEEVIPEVRLTRSRSGDSGTATFIFTNPRILDQGNTEEITGMYLIDEEGEIVTREVKGKFINGKPEALEAVHLMKSAAEWERFMRFMERYAAENDLGFNKAQ